MEVPLVLATSVCRFIAIFDVEGVVKVAAPAASILNWVVLVPEVVVLSSILPSPELTSDPVTSAAMAVTPEPNSTESPPLVAVVILIAILKFP